MGLRSLCLASPFGARHHQGLSARLCRAFPLPGRREGLGFWVQGLGFSQNYGPFLGTLKKGAVL